MCSNAWLIYGCCRFCSGSVIANYGASQGFDTDDGSSWYDIHDNFFFMADAWKM